MNKDVFPVAELNLPLTGSGKFSWELLSNEVAQIPRKNRSDPPDFHLQLGGRGDDTVPLTSTPKIVDPINVNADDISAPAVIEASPIVYSVFVPSAEGMTEFLQLRVQPRVETE